MAAVRQTEISRLGRGFELVLAATLSENGVKQLSTRNTKDFDDFGFFTVADHVRNPDNSLGVAEAPAAGATEGAREEAVARGPLGA